MLVLTRKVGEGVKIDENIFVRIVQVKGKQVRLGIEAPKETRIQREELNSPKPPMGEVVMDTSQANPTSKS